MASRAAVASSTPVTSIRCLRPSRRSGMMTKVSASTITPIGRLTKKM